MTQAALAIAVGALTLGQVATQHIRVEVIQHIGAESNGPTITTTDGGLTTITPAEV